MITTVDEVPDALHQPEGAEDQRDHDAQPQHVVDDHVRIVAWR